MNSTTLSTILFVVFVLFTLVLVIRAGKSNKKNSSDFYDGGASFSGFQNGLAIAGDYMSAASFLGIAGMIALAGYDGFLYSIGFLVAWLVALLLVAEPLRNSGRFTMGDVVAFRMKQRPVRSAASASTVVVSIFYLLAQMVGAGSLVALLLGIDPTDTAAKNLIIGVVGILMIVYVTVGGMKGTTYVQIVKAFLLMIGATVLTIMVLARFGFDISAMLGQAQKLSGNPELLNPGNKYGVEVEGDPFKTLMNKLDLISLGLALVLGTAGLPHILIRFYTVPTAKAARTSVNWAIGNIGVFYLMTIALGFGAAALVGSTAIKEADKGGNLAAPLLAKELGTNIAGETGGATMLAIIGAIAFATILAVVAGLTLASSSSFAHDFYANVIKKGNVDPKKEVNVARIAAILIGAVSIVLAIGAQGLNVAFLVAIAFAIAASANLPAVLFSLFWKRFNTRGAVWAIYGGLGMALVLLVFSGNVSGAETSFIKCLPDAVDCVKFNYFPLNNPGIVSIPFGFFMGWLGTITSNENNTAKYAELEVRSMTGAAIGKAVQH
ncbi:cation acetate symporter [Rhodoluna sp. KAS3]|uniref:solute symporter family protein n=1 Tax=Rhodoluna sp. KAS3 TaxID=942880 RepID=UPI00223205BF|nr:cation acetate symporter [Rhodoluna sp. KAS3]BDS49466.1 cation acetate symporter [Rhodoluna sp. KAS3]